MSPPLTNAYEKWAALVLTRAALRGHTLKRAARITMRTARRAARRSLLRGEFTAYDVVHALRRRDAAERVCCLLLRGASLEDLDDAAAVS